jgi:peroxiredoxin family protein
MASIQAAKTSQPHTNGKSTEERIQLLEKKLAELEEKMPEDKVSLVVFSGDLDRVLASFILATGAAAMGQQVRMFFTFWGYNAIRKQRVLSGKNIMEKMMAMMSPGSSQSLPVSKMNFFGIGAKMLRTMMKNKNVASLEDLIKMAREMGVQIIACEMSRDVMGIKDKELIEGLEPGGVASFLADALKSRATLFI